MLGLWGIAIPMFLVFSTNGIIAACSNAAALSKVPDEITGSAAALIGALQYGSGMISSALLAVFSDGTPVAMCCIITGFVLLAAVAAFAAEAPACARRPAQKTSTSVVSHGCKC